MRRRDFLKLMMGGGLAVGTPLLALLKPAKPVEAFSTGIVAQPAHLEAQRTLTETYSILADSINSERIWQETMRTSVLDDYLFYCGTRWADIPVRPAP